MFVKCVCNEGFEDSLTEMGQYYPHDIRGASVMIHDDKGRARWFGISKFEIIY